MATEDLEDQSASQEVAAARDEDPALIAKYGAFIEVLTLLVGVGFVGLALI